MSQRAAVVDSGRLEAAPHSIDSELRLLEQEGRLARQQYRRSIERFALLEQQALEDIDATASTSSINHTDNDVVESEECFSSPGNNANPSHTAASTARDDDSQDDNHTCSHNSASDEESFGDASAWGDVHDLPSYITASAHGDALSDEDLAGN
jgi:hypothetical protein